MDKVYSFHTQEELNQTSDSLITAIVTAISDLFPGIPIDQVVRRIEVSPVGRMENLSNLLRGSNSETELSIPCGNFSRQYACMCDYYGLPYREEVAWDVDTIYMSHNSKELNLRDFDHLDPKDLIPIIAALELNSFFLQFRCSHLKLSHECSERLLAVLKKSTTLEEIYVDNAGFKGDFANKLSMAIISNSNSSLHGIDLSHNLIEDRGTHTLHVCYFSFLFLAVLTILFIYLFFHFLDLILFSLSCTIYMPCMQALLAYAVSWPKLDKVKDFLDKPRKAYLFSKVSIIFAHLMVLQQILLHYSIT
ncbi:hypothetical protein OUZ56_009091 [Daphnia magna]|uniref:Leucine-rich repeat-containing protein n=1 Tax=Daphnia magna TaxID=35525 RepID=A0ABR0AEZ1_9CRUS|nr:hypothetical protein OUZ56_009091 [Daphnia magna]